MGPKPKQLLRKAENELRSRFGINKNLQIVLKKLQPIRLLQAHGKNPTMSEVPCPFCNYMCASSTLLNLHLRRHTGEKPYKCPHCNYQSATSCNLTRHVNRIHKKIIPPKKSICQLCSETFATYHQLDAHILRHTGERPFSCQHCKKEFTVVARKRRHENICKMNPQQSDATWVASQNSFKCNLCEYSTRQNYQLKSHLQKHVMSKRYKCAYETCDYQTSFSGNLMRHERYHTSNRPFKCSACSKSFVTCSELKRHKSPCQRRQDRLKTAQGATHHLAKAEENPRPFKCDSHDCDVAFKTKGGLTQHVSYVHSHSRPFKCLVSSCTKSFMTKNKLQLHITSHSRI